MTRIGFMDKEKRRHGRALIVSVLTGLALGGGVERAAAAAVGGHDGLPPGRSLVERHYGPAAPAETLSHGAEASLGERQETRWRRWSPFHALAGAPATGPVPLCEASGREPESDSDGALARTGRRATWPTGPPILSL